MADSDSDDELGHSESLAIGIESLISPMVAEVDGHVENVIRSQRDLSSSIERLSNELNKLIENTPESVARAHAAKLGGIRKRVHTLTSNVTSIQERLNRLHVSASRLPGMALADLARAELPGLPPAEGLAARLSRSAAGGADAAGPGPAAGGGS